MWYHRMNEIFVMILVVLLLFCMAGCITPLPPKEEFVMMMPQQQSILLYAHTQETATVCQAALGVGVVGLGLSVWTLLGPVSDVGHGLQAISRGR